MMPETVICGKMFVEGTLQYAEVAVDGGKITAVAKHIPGGDERIELGSSKTVLPGFIDPHVHFRDPGLTEKENFQTGSLSALCGGVTCVLDMPNTKPPVTDLETLMDKKRIVKGRSFVDYGLFAALSPGARIRLLAPHVPAFKLFMGSTTGNILLNDDDEIAPLMDDIAATGLPLSVHGEDDSMISREPETCNRDHLRNRPVSAELSCIKRLARYPGVRVNICHTTNPEQVEAAKAAGFTTEVTMHHLLFNADRNPDAFCKVNPPLRDENTRRGLFDSFVKGRIDMFGSDHAPHTAAEKEREYGSAPGGIPGVETTIPLVLDLVRSGVIPMAQAVAMGSFNAASVFGINKGSIAEGKDADFAIFDFRDVREIDDRLLHSRCGWSPYKGMRAVFPDMVITGGRVALEDGEPCGEPAGRDIRA